MLIGVVAGAATWFACNVIKSKFKYDDSLDTFGVHAVGGAIVLVWSVVGTLALDTDSLRPTIRLQCSRARGWSAAADGCRRRPAWH